MSTSIQPLSSIGPADPEKAREEELKKDPAKRDYLEGREQFKKGDHSMAAMSFHNALKAFEERGDDEGVANASDRLGDVCLAKKDFVAALEHYQRAYAICEKEEDSFSTLSLNKKIAAIYREQGELDKAMEIIFDMVEHYHLTSNPQGMVEVMSLIAQLYQEKGENKKAADTYRTVASIHKNFSHKRKAEEFAALADELEQA